MSFKRSFARFCLALGALVLCSSFCAAQVVLEGRISDPAGALVPHVPLSLQSQDHTYKQNSVSDERGMFHLLEVPPGHYILSVAGVNGFDDYETQIQIGQKTPPMIKVVLTLASVHQQTNVDSGQNSVSTDASDNRDQIVTTASTLAHLPVLDQNYIATLTPFLDQAGVATSGVSIIVDGVEMKGTGVSASAILEARINNDPYSAETNVPGKGRIEIMTKPGTPKFHGSFNFGFRDSATDATNYFALTRPQERKRIYEGSITGPLGRDTKTTFLISGTRQEDDLQAVVHALGPSGAVFANVPTPMRDTEFAIRVTHDFTPSHRASFQYNVSDVVTRNQGVGGLVEAETGVNAQSREDDLIFNDRLTLSPVMINQLQILLEKDHDPARSVLDAPKIVIDGSSTSGGAQVDLLTTENNMKVNDTLSWSHGRHYLKFGLNIPNVSRRAWEDHSNRQGTFSFASLTDYNAARPYSFTQQQGPGRTVFWWIEVGAFVQDQIQLTPDLQVSVGIRYDWQTYFSSIHDIAPRVSLAYAPKGHKTVLRLGAGLFYDRAGANPIADLKRFNGVVLRSYTVLDPTYPDPLPPGTFASDLPTNLVQLAPASHLPYSTHYSVGIEHQITSHSSVAATYRGVIGASLFRSRDVNAPLPPDYSIVPKPQFGVIREIEFEGRQLQNALDLTLQGKLGRLFSGVAQYTWSHTNNDTSGITWFPANQYDNTGEYSRADFDQHHRFNLLGVLNEGHWANLGLGVNLYSGTPYTETSGIDTYRTGLLNARPTGVERNSLQGGGYAELDARWSHDFFFSRSSKDSDPHLSLSIDAFNLPNHVNYASYVGNVQSAFFGTPTAALPARRFQMTVGFTF
jgi:TonB dependent receptor/Carboxypeptidase regulatory-like domain